MGWYFSGLKTHQAISGANGQAGGANFTDPSTPAQVAYFSKVFQSIPIRNGGNNKQILMAHQVIYTTCLACVKMSFLFLFRRLFVAKRLPIFLNIVSLGVILWWLVICVLTILEYHKVSMNIIVFWIATMVTNLASDIVILTIPQFFVWKLHMSLHKKLVLAFTFLLGGW